MKDPEARQFFAVRDTIAKIQPAVYMLENVLGLMQVIDEVKRQLRKAGDYFIVTTVLDPLDFGCPLTRRRVYIVGVRRDLLPNKTDDELSKVAQQVVKAIIRVWSLVIV